VEAHAPLDGEREARTGSVVHGVHIYQ
jgi:hypothetical protein